MKRAGIFMIVGSLLLSGLFFLPLWNIELGAPQYPEPLGIDIYINGLQGQSEFDIQNIDGLNHYIGMKTLPKPEDMWEFQVFPMVVGFMVFLGVLIGILAIAKKLNHNWFLGWFVLMSVLGVLGIYDFNLWMIDYGTNLDPHAILKLQNPDGTPMSYKPPLIGHKQLLNFDAYSYPQSGAYLMLIGMGLTLLAYFVGKKKTLAMKAAMILVLPFLAIACTPKQEAIIYGQNECSFCTMTIVDKIHGAELVTSKGKVYKYDAIECMMLAIKEKEDLAMVLVNHLGQPEELIDATQATFLISEQLPSPMGGNITAFSSRESAEIALNKYQGELFTWSELTKRY